jgi:hypothetical protein
VGCASGTRICWCRSTTSASLDDVEVSQLEWKRGSYDTTQLNNFYTGNDARAG